MPAGGRIPAYGYGPAPTTKPKGRMKRQDWVNVLTVTLVVLFAGGWAVGRYTGPAPKKPQPQAAFVGETIYIVNHDQADWSNAAIWHDIPAWEQAANKDFAPIWHTPQIQIKVVDKAPKHAIVAEFVASGSVQGALAYHTVVNGYPRIVSYLGTAKFYGYSQSVDFTHELFEMLADPTVSVTNQGFPYPIVTLGNQTLPITPGTIWLQEVCDPVEADGLGFKVDGVRMSDFVTPNWFNDKVAGGYDFTGNVQLPFTVLRGGYAQFWNGQSWSQVTNFRKAGRDPSGFLKAERHAP